MVTRTRLYTAEELAAMPGDEPWELWHGELRKVPGAGAEASGLAHWIGALITVFVHPRKLGWVNGADGTFRMHRNPDVVVVPDISFTKWEHLPERKAPKGFINGRPDLATEVKSPSDRQHDIDMEMQLYRDAGVPLVWWVYPDEREIVVFRSGVLAGTLRSGDVLDGDDVLPGFSVSVDEIFSVL